MKKPYFLLCGLLAASLCCMGAQAAASPAQPKDRAVKSRPGKAVKTPRPDGRQHAAALPTAPIPPSIAPQGLGLALSTALQKFPPPANPPVPIGPAVYAPYQGQAIAKSRENPYLPRQTALELPRQAFAPVRAPEVPRTEGFRTDVGAVLGGLVNYIPLLPESGRSILPKITKVYPTGEKPLVVLSFKCPTELVGVTPPTIKLLHDAVSLGMEGINRTNLLSFDLQQVCQ
jgi:hypothetical protein